jgi:hypothetical protein
VRAIAAPHSATQRVVYVRGSADSFGPTPTPPTCHGVLVTPLAQKFDLLIPPALPHGWLATNALGPPPLWVTSDSGVPMPPADSPPNSAFVDDPDVISDKRLDSTVLLPPEPGLQWRRLTFRHDFNFDADVDPAVGFDGGVLEISFDGGNTFQIFSRLAGHSFRVGTTELSLLIAGALLQDVKRGVAVLRGLSP